jgi:protein phosphatase
MVRFEEIREILRTTAEPLDACKALTERANQAGGHDNITVIVVKFDGEGLKAVGDGTEPLKYRKYMLPEEPPEHTEPNRRMQASGGETPASGSPVTAGQPVVHHEAPIPNHPQHEGTHARQGLASTVMFQATPVQAAGSPNTPQAGWAPQPAHAEGEERIDIPGTHVPAWVVVLLVVGVVALLGATAFVLLR